MNSFDSLLRRVLMDAADEDVEWETPLKPCKPIIDFKEVTQMKNKDLEKYITELSPELQEKARHCKNMDELNELLAENDAELSEDALEAAAGGAESGEAYGREYDPGDLTPWICPICGESLMYVQPLSIEDKTHLLVCRHYSCAVSNRAKYMVGIEDDSNTVYVYNG